MNLNTIPGSRLRGFCLAVSLTMILGACSTTPSDPHANEFAMVPAQRGGTGKNPNNPNHKTNATYGVGDADDSAMDSADESRRHSQHVRSGAERQSIASNGE